MKSSVTSRLTARGHVNIEQVLCLGLLNVNEITLMLAGRIQVFRMLEMSDTGTVWILLETYSNQQYTTYSKIHEKFICICSWPAIKHGSSKKSYWIQRLVKINYSFSFFKIRNQYYIGMTKNLKKSRNSGRRVSDTYETQIHFCHLWKCVQRKLDIPRTAIEMRFLLF